MFCTRDATKFTFACWLCCGSATFFLTPNRIRLSVLLPIWIRIWILRFPILSYNLESRDDELFLKTGEATLHLDVQRLRYANSNQCCGSALDSVLIRIQHFRSMRLRRIRIRDQNHYDQKFKNLTAEKIHVCEGLTSFRSSLHPQKRTSITSKNMTLLHFFDFFLILCFIFVLLDQDPGDQYEWGSDQDPQH